MLRIAVLSLFFSFLVGCASVSKEELASAYFSPVPSNYESQIESHFSSRLKDPYSAKYRYLEPRCAFAQDGLINGNGKHFGYIVPVSVNAKNSFGAYVGERIYYMFFSEGRMGDVTGLMGQMAHFVDCP